MIWQPGSTIASTYSWLLTRPTIDRKECDSRATIGAGLGPSRSKWLMYTEYGSGTTTPPGSSGSPVQVRSSASSLVALNATVRVSTAGTRYHLPVKALKNIIHPHANQLTRANLRRLENASEVRDVVARKHYCVDGHSRGFSFEAHQLQVKVCPLCDPESSQSFL